MIGTIIIASVFNNTTTLGNAYGVCVIFVTFFDTTMVSLAAMFVWKIPPYIVFFPWAVFACMDGAFLSSALTKVPQGAWFTLTLAAILASVLLLWRYGKEQQWFAEAEDRFPTSHFLVKDGTNDGMRLADRYQGIPLSRLKGLGIYFDKAGETTPIVFSQFVLKLTALPEVIVFFHLRPLETPYIAPGERFTVSKLSVPHCYRCVVRYGYNDEIVTPDLASVIYEQVRRFIIERHGGGDDDEEEAVVSGNNIINTNPLTSTDGTFLRRRSLALVPEYDGTTSTSELELPFTSSATSFSDSKAKQKPTSRVVEASSSDSPAPQTDNDDLAKLDAAYAHKVLYIVGKEQMRIKPDTSIARGVLLSMFLWLRDNTRGKIANLKVPTGDLVEVGFLKEI